MAKIIDFKRYLEEKRKKLKDKDIFANIDKMFERLWNLQFNPPDVNKK